MFLREEDLVEKFWKFYNGRGRAIKFQFECPIREGNADLVTIEKYQDNYQINAFEFKLDDMKKVILQAEFNAKFVNKSWIVVPIEKKSIIEKRYLSACKEHGIGIFYVEAGGRWEKGLSPRFNKNIPMIQPLVNLMMKGY